MARQRGLRISLRPPRSISDPSSIVISAQLAAVGALAATTKLYRPISAQLAASGALTAAAFEAATVSTGAILAASGKLAAATKQTAMAPAILRPAGNVFASTQYTGFAGGILAAQGTFRSSLVLPPVGARIAASGALAAYAVNRTAASIPPTVQSVEERIYPEIDVHLVSSLECSDGDSGFIWHVDRSHFARTR